MSTETKNETPGIPLISPETISVTSSFKHGIGDSLAEKPLSPTNSKDELTDLGPETSSFASCQSFKTICRAWKNRLKSPSTMSLDRGIIDFESDLEEVTSKLDMTTAFAKEDSKDVGRRISLCVMLESRSLRLTDSSEEETPGSLSKQTHRFFEPEEIRHAFVAFKMYDVNCDNFIELSELKLALEKLSVPQTHLAAKELMAEVAGQHATQINFCQFLLTYAAILEGTKPRLLPSGDPHLDAEPAKERVPTMPSVSDVGVAGAKLFFKAKIAQQAPESIPLMALPEDNLTTSGSSD